MSSLFAVWLLLLFLAQTNVSFKLTDRGIVVTYHAAVSGGFYLYSVNGKQVPQLIHDLFDHPRTIQAPFHPFVTQYDTYLMRYDDVVN